VTSATSLRRRFALGIFAVYALFMVGAAIMTVESSLFVKKHPPRSLSPNDGSGTGRRE